MIYIDLCPPVFPWDYYFCATKRAIKLQVGFSHNGYVSEFAVITKGNTSDIEVGRTLAFPTGSIVAIDRDFLDYEWFNQLTNKRLICNQMIVLTGNDVVINVR